MSRRWTSRPPEYKTIEQSCSLLRVSTSVFYNHVYSLDLDTSGGVSPQALDQIRKRIGKAPVALKRRSSAADWVPRWHPRTGRPGLRPDGNALLVHGISEHGIALEFLTSSGLSDAVKRKISNNARKFCGIEVLPLGDLMVFIKNHRRAFRPLLSPLREKEKMLMRTVGRIRPEEAAFSEGGIRGARNTAASSLSTVRTIRTWITRGVSGLGGG